MPSRRLGFVFDHQDTHTWIVSCGMAARVGKGPQVDKSLALATDPSPGASLLLGHVPTGMLPRRASPAGRLGRDHRSIYPFEGPKPGLAGRRTEGESG